MLRTSLQSARAVRSRPLLAVASASASASVSTSASVFRPAAACATRPWRPVGAASKRLFSISTPKAMTPAPSSSSSTPAPRQGGFFRKLRNYLLTISILGALTFGGGVWYSRVNDTFHDLFTEYVPFGEQAVLYLEELDFQKRFPNMAERVSPSKPRDTGTNVRVPAQSGASWRVADTSSRQSAAAAEVKAAPAAAPEKPKAAKPAKAEKAEKPTKAVKAAEPAAKTEAEPAPIPTPTPTPTPAAKADDATPAAAAALSYRPPEVDEPSRWPPASPIDPLAVRDAAEPVVQDVVHMLNDIITVINADKAGAKYAGAIGKAKEEANRVGAKIRAIRAAAEAEAAGQVAARTESFDTAARELVDRVEAAMAAQEKEWRAEVDAELAAARQRYEERLAVATAREQQLSAERQSNALLEQAVQMTQQFAAELQAHVEQERGGRLGRLEALAASVADLEALTAGWTDVVDASQRTQQLHVAIDAVRAKMASTEDAAATTTATTTTPPFVKELVAIKEIASADPVVDAAIASIPPAAYQRGLTSPAGLVDRFRRVAAEVRKASLLPDDAGVASHASSYVLSKVLFKKQPGAGDSDTDAAADDVESILTRTQAFLEEGNLDGAAREMNGLKGWAKTLSRDWLGEVRKLLEVQQAVDVITAEARLRSLQLEKSA